MQEDSLAVCEYSQPDGVFVHSNNPATVERRFNPRKLLKVITAPLLLLVASIAFVSANANHEQMSPLDEYVYIDYLSKVPEQGIVRQGEMTGEFARQYYSCIGVGIFGTIAPDNCSTGEYDKDSDYPFDGKTSAESYTPLYFAATWIAAQPFIWATGGDIVLGGRLAGSLWLAGAAIMLYLGMKRLKISPVARYGAALLLIASPAAWSANTFISTDAPSMFAGASLLYLGFRFLQTGKGSTLLVLGSVIAVALKLQNFMAVVAIALFLLIMFLARKRAPEAIPSLQTTGSGRRIGWVTGLMIVSPLVFQVLWTLLVKALAVGEPTNAGDPSTFGIDALIKEAFRFYGTLNFNALIPAEATIGWALTKLSTWIITAGIIAIIAIEPRFSTRYSLSLAALITILTAGPALALAIRLMQGYYFELPQRYAMSLLPIALALGAALFDKKSETRIAFLAIGGVTFVASLTPYFPGNVFS